MKQDSKAQPVEGDSSFRPHRDEDSATATITPSCDHPLSALPSLRKSALYTVCSIAVATEALSTSCLFTATKIVAEDENLTSGGNAVWIFSASAIAFAACIPLGGRLADVSPPHWWLVSGLLGMSAFALGNSFVYHNKALFLALRALQGICSALTLPSGFAMIVHMYPNQVQQRTRLVAVSLMISLAMACGFVIGGVLMLASWRWIFRFLAIVTFLCGGSCWLLIPHANIREVETQASPAPRWSETIGKLDLPGVGLILGALLLLNLGLTSATVYGWADPHFIAPFVIGVFLLPVFCLWEAKQDVQHAMLPVAIMKQRKFIVVCFSGMVAEMWFAITQLGPSRFFQEVLHDKAMIVGAKLLPQVIGCTLGGLLHTFYLSKHVPPKYTILTGMLLCIAPGTILIILSGGGKGNNYWALLAPGYLTGSTSIIVVWDAASVLAIQAVPSGYSGIASSIFLMFVLTGIAVGTPIQAGFYTAVDNGLADWRGSQYGFYFVIGCIAVAMLLVFTWLPASKPNDDLATELGAEGGEGGDSPMEQEKTTEVRRAT